MYYGNLFVATALAGGDKKVVSLVNETTLTAYGIYESGTDEALEAVAIVNLQMWNSTQAVTERPYTTVELPVSDGQTWSNAKVRRLTAPGVETKSGITFASRTVGSDGSLVGEEELEGVSNGKNIRVAAGEAVLVTK